MHQLKIVVYYPRQQQLQWIIYLIFMLNHNTKIKLFLQFSPPEFTTEPFYVPAVSEASHDSSISRSHGLTLALSYFAAHVTAYKQQWTKVALSPLLYS